MNKPETPDLVERDVAPDASALGALVRAEIDGQIATAHAFPRKMAAFMREARELVSLDEETAEACIYSLPRGKERDPATGRMVPKFITGPSARFAEIIMHSFGNNRGGGRIVAVDRETITAQGVFHDLEKNVMVTKEVQRRILDSQGRRYNADMIGVTGNAAVSIALRNAVLAGIPQAIWLPVYEAARETAVGDVTSLSQRRSNALAWFAKVGVSAEQVLAKLGVEGAEDIGLEQMETLVGIKTAIRRGDVTPERAFTPEPEAQTTASAAGMADIAAAIAEQRAQAAEVAP